MSGRVMIPRLEWFEGPQQSRGTLALRKLARGVLNRDPRYKKRSGIIVGSPGLGFQTRDYSEKNLEATLAEVTKEDADRQYWRNQKDSIEEAKAIIAALQKHISDVGAELSEHERKNDDE